MMMMRMKHYGFRSGNDIKDGGFCTGTNDRGSDKNQEISLFVDNDEHDIVTIGIIRSVERETISRTSRKIN